MPGRNVSQTYFEPPGPPPGGDVTPPVVNILNPVPGGALPVNGAVTFTVTDDSGAFALIPVWVKLPNGTVELVHDGADFTAPYNGLSSVSSIALGYSYSARRNQGWPEGVVRITMKPVDSSGNVA